MAKTYEPIQTVTVANNTTTTINFSSIPQTYTDLRLVGCYSYYNTGLGGSDTLMFRVNADANSGRYNYSYARAYLGSFNTSYSFGNAARFDLGSLSYEYSPSIAIIDFCGYTTSTGTNPKGIIGIGAGVFGTGTAGQSNLINTMMTGSYVVSGGTIPAITSIQLIYNTYYFKQGSKFTLYGIQAI